MDADETLATIEEIKESQKRLEERELQKSKLAQEKEIEIKKLNGIKEIEKEKLELVKARLGQQKEFELELLNKEMEAREKEKLYQLDIEKGKLKKEENIEKEKLELEKIKIEMAHASPTVTEASPSKVQVNLPKLTFPNFYGNILKWSEFWDSFHSAVDQNKGLNAVDKLNYLRRPLEGEAYGCIAGLELTEANYFVAITLLQKRYGDSQIIINAHYKELMDLPESPNQTRKLSQTFDTIEKHLRSLQVLGEDINHKH